MKTLFKITFLFSLGILTACVSFPPPSIAANALQVDFLVSGILGTDNKPLASGKVYTYSAGSTSTINLYSSADKTGYTANPIILNNRGAATAYADGYYKFVIKDKNDVTIATYDNMYYVVPSTSAVSVTNISATYTTSSNTELIKANTAGGSITINLVSAVGNGGLKFIIIKTSASNTLTIDPYSSQTINGAATYDLTLVNETLEIISDNANWVIVNNPTSSSSGITASSTSTLTNKSLVDSSTYIIDNVDNTKKFQFQVSGNTASSTRTYAVPNYDGTLATLAGTETLTNKTITAPVLSGTTTGTYIIGGTPTVSSPILDGTVTGTFDFGTLRGRPVVSKTTTYAANITTDETILCDSSGGAWVLSLPVGVSGKEYIIKKTDNFFNAVTITPNGSEKIDGLSVYKLYFKDEGIQIKYDITTTNWIVMNYIPSDIIDYTGFTSSSSITNDVSTSFLLQGMGKNLFINLGYVGVSNDGTASLSVPTVMPYEIEGSSYPGSVNLRKGSTNHYYVGWATIQFRISSTWYTKTGSTTGMAPGTDAIPQNKWGAIALDIGTDGAIHIISATDNASGYSTEDLAISGIPALAASHVRMGTVSVIKTDGIFTFGTTNFDAANVTTRFRNNKNSRCFTGAGYSYGETYGYPPTNLGHLQVLTCGTGDRNIMFAKQWAGTGWDFNSWSGSAISFQVSGLLPIDRTQ
jgi:hypothetical protein